jgi:predicted  nucleic acid-binding Zn-ribbon protein
MVTVTDIQAKRKKLEQLGRDLAVAEERQRQLTEQLEAVNTELKELTGGAEPTEYLKKLDDELETLEFRIDTGLAEAQTYIDQMKGTGDGKAES